MTALAAVGGQPAAVEDAGEQLGERVSVAPGRAAQVRHALVGRPGGCQRGQGGVQRRRGLVVHPAPEGVHAGLAVGDDDQLPVRDGRLLRGREPVCPVRVQDVQQVPAEPAQQLGVVPFGLLEEERLPLRAGGCRHRGGQGLHGAYDDIGGVLADRPVSERGGGGGELARHRLPGHRDARVEGGGEADLGVGRTKTHPQGVAQPTRRGRRALRGRCPPGVDLADQAQPLGGEGILRLAQGPQPRQQFALGQRPRLGLGQRVHGAAHGTECGEHRVRAVVESVVHALIVPSGTDNSGARRVVHSPL